MKTHRPASILALVWVSLLGFALSACQQGGASVANHLPNGSAPQSLYATIANGKVDIEGGLVEVAARRAGIVKDVLVQEGDAVRKGQILARLEDEDSLLAVNSAQAAVRQAQSQVGVTQVSIQTAQRERERLERLAGTGLVSRQQVDQAEDSLSTARAQLEMQLAAVQTAQAQLAQAKYSADLTIIRAPLDGKIVRRYANPGAGASTLNVSNMFDLEPETQHIVRAEVIESALPDVHVGQRAEIASEADPDKVTRGRVVRIASVFGARKLKSDAANEATDERVVEVVVSAENMPYLLGQRVLVKLLKSDVPASGPPTPTAQQAPAR